MKKSLFVLFLTANLWANEYTLLYFANGQIRTPTEILNETKIPLESLQLFHCRSEERNNLFFDFTAQNPDEDSLKVFGLDQKTYYYKNNSLYSIKGRKIRKVKDSFAKAVLVALNKISESELGKKLINRLQKSYAPFYIQKGRNQYNPANLDQRTNTHGNDATMIVGLDELRPMVERMPFSQIGFTGRINWNENLKAKLIESDYVEREIPAYIALAHEMFHAYDGMRGLLDRRFVHGNNLEMSPVAEYRAVYFENQMRKDFGFKYRRFYSKQDDITRDMLDDRDEPILLPTPCINWL